MRPVYLLFAVLLFTACQKKDTYRPTYPEYQDANFLIASKDASWKVRIMSLSNNANVNSLKAYLDQLTTEEFIIRTVGKDTLISSRVYHVYQVEQYTTGPSPDSAKSLSIYRQYLREDSAAKKVYFVNNVLAMDFSDSTRKQVKPFFTWREMDVVQPDDIILGDLKFKRWNMRNLFDTKMEYYYQAQGMGNFYGIIQPYTNFSRVSQVVSLDFTYKGETAHFDYPLQ